MSINLEKLFRYYVDRDERISESGQSDDWGRVIKVSLPACFDAEICGETESQERYLRDIGLADCVEDESARQTERFKRVLPLLYHLAGSYLNVPSHQMDRPYWESGALRWQKFLGFGPDGPHRGLPDADVALGENIQYAENIMAQQPGFDRAALHVAGWSLYDVCRRKIDMMPMKLIRGHDADKGHDCPFKNTPG